MLINEHQVSTVTQLYDVLSERLIPEIADNKRFIANYLAGKRGETKFREWLSQLGDECLVLSDMTLANEETQCQIDFIVITHRKMIIYEVKNYRGTWVLKDNLLSLNDQLNIPNPTLKMKRSEAMLRTQLHQSVKDYSIENFCLFINENFNLVTTESREHLLEFDHLSWHLFEINQSIAPLDKKDWEIATSLLTLNELDYIPEKLPIYSLSKINKGLACPHCQTFNQNKISRKLTCLECLKTTPAHQAILYAAYEFQLIFPHEKLTTSKLYDFIGCTFQKVTVSRALKSKYTMANKYKYTYFQ